MRVYVSAKLLCFYVVFSHGLGVKIGGDSMMQNYAHTLEGIV